jgi:putative ABC transport system substrate-binding protein
VGRDVVIEYRFANNDPERIRAMAAELAALRCELIVVASVFAVRAAMQAAPATPIVIAATGDPVGMGLVPALRRPGGNVTGLTLQSSDLGAKRLQLLREIVPGAARFALLGMSEPDQADPDRKGAELMREDLAATARRIGGSVSARTIARPGEIDAAFDAFRAGGAQAVVVQATPLSLTHVAPIVAAAARTRLPAMYELRSFAEAGGLVAYGPDLVDMYRRAAGYVDRILRGAKPGDLAIEQPAKFDLVVNLRTAAALGVDIPPAVLLRADDVIR